MSAWPQIAKSAYMTKVDIQPVITCKRGVSVRPGACYFHRTVVSTFTLNVHFKRPTHFASESKRPLGATNWKTTLKFPVEIEDGTSL